MIKKLCIIFLMILIIFQMVNTQEPIKMIDRNPPDSWYKLTDEEKYKQLVIIHDIARELYGKVEYKQQLLEESKKVIQDYEEILKAKKSFYPKFGFGINAQAGISYNQKKPVYYDRFSSDVYTGIDFYIFFLRGRIALVPSMNVKIYDEIGGAIGLGVLFLFGN